MYMFNKDEAIIFDLENGQYIAELCPGATEEQGALLAAAPETAAERDRLKEINAEMLEALKNTGNVLAGLATGQLKEIQPDSPALYKIRRAITKAEALNN